MNLLHILSKNLKNVKMGSTPIGFNLIFWREWWKGTEANFFAVMVDNLSIAVTIRS